MVCAGRELDDKLQLCKIEGPTAASKKCPAAWIPRALRQLGLSGGIKKGPDDVRLLALMIDQQFNVVMMGTIRIAKDELYLYSHIFRKSFYILDSQPKVISCRNAG